MLVKTKAFGEIDIAQDKVINFEHGMIGFPDLTKFVLLHDEERGTEAGIRWLQSLDEPLFALPVMDPLLVKPDYNPEVEDEQLNRLEPLDDELLVLVTVTVPSDLTKMSVNLQGPIIINVTSREACQVIINTDTYPVKYPIYDFLQDGKAGE